MTSRSRLTAQQLTSRGQRHHSSDEHSLAVSCIFAPGPYPNSAPVTVWGEIFWAGGWRRRVVLGKKLQCRVAEKDQMRVHRQ